MFIARQVNKVSRHRQMVKAFANWLFVPLNFEITHIVIIVFVFKTLLSKILFGGKPYFINPISIDGNTLDI